MLQTAIQLNKASLVAQRGSSYVLFYDEIQRYIHSRNPTKHNGFESSVASLTCLMYVTDRSMGILVLATVRARNKRVWLQTSKT